METRKIKWVIVISIWIMLIALYVWSARERETVTITKFIEKPVVEAALPTKANNFFFNVPLSHSLQSYIYEICTEEEVPITLVLAIIETESGFNPEIISETNDYGLMQINAINHDRLKEEYRTADMLDPYQNTFCGIKIIAGYVREYDGDYTKALMAYNMGNFGANKAWENGITSTAYTEKILKCMVQYEVEFNEQQEDR